MPGGALAVPGHPTRVGVFPYKLTDGTVRRELRPPEEVFHPDSLATLAHAPVTALHPADQVNPKNWKEHAIGHVAGPVEAKAPHVAAMIILQDGAAQARVDSGEWADLSSGYTADLEDTQGVWQGQEYDAIQRNIRYNHVGLGPPGWGRGGPTVGLRLDAADAIQVQDGQEEQTDMKTIRIDGKDYVVGSEEHMAKVDAMIAAEKARADAAEAKAKTETTRADAAEAKVKELEPKVLAPEALTKMVTARATILDQFRRLDSKTFRAPKGQEKDRPKLLQERLDKASGNNDLAMMLEMIKMIDPSFDGASQSEDFIRGAFMVLVKPALAKLAPAMADPADEDTEEEPAEEPLPAAPIDAAGAPPVPPGAEEEEEEDPAVAKDSVYSGRAGRKPAANQTPAKPKNADQARAQMIKDSQEAWRKPLHLSVRQG
jgi:hypothetical protein